MITLLLMSCGQPTPPETGSTTQTGVVTSETSTETIVEFASPVVATDIDDDPSIHHVELTASLHTYVIDGQEIQGYAYNNVVPGPTIRANVGDTLIVDLTNKLDTPTTIHWHGISLPWDQDGIVWMQDPVEAGTSRRYEFTLNTVMTAWYHPHFDTEKQIDLGLYGVLIVEDPTAPKPDKDLTLVFDSWGEHDNKSANEGHDHGENSWVSPDDWTVNSLVQPTITANGGERIRARLINTSNSGYLKVSWPNLRHIGGDQGLLAQADSPDALVLGPGDRAEVEWLIGDESFAIMAHPYSLFGGDAVGEPAVVASIDVINPAPTPDPLPFLFSGEAPSVDAGHTDVRYTLQGYGENWMINGETFPDVTVAEVHNNQTIIIEARNISQTHHPFHTHGHAFEVLSLNGEVPPVKLIADNFDLPIGAIARLQMTLNNPGDWMVHCHIVSHADGGMMTVLRVLE